MSLPAQFLAALALDDFSVYRWLEIEGIPHAFGTKGRDSSWFASRPAIERFTSILPYFNKTPSSFDAQLDVMAGMAKTMGQTQFDIVDVDGEQTLWAGAWDNTATRELSIAISVSDTDISYGGIVAADTSLYPTGGGTIYIGNETITYTAHNTGLQQFTGCVRGKYKSRPQAWLVGATISHKPYVMYGRRVWYYQVAEETPAAITATRATDNDKVLRFSGSISNYELDSSDAGVYILTCLSLEQELTRDIFRDLRTVRDTQQRGMVGHDFSKPGLRFASDPGGSSTSDRLYSEDINQLDENADSYFVHGDYKMFQVDKEIVMFSVYVSGNQAWLNLEARGLMGTPIEEHKPGFDLKELAWSARYDAGSALWEHFTSKWTSASDTVSMAAGDHPLIALLCVMLSTGDGTNTGSGRNYDVLPKEWGLGIPFDRVDIQAIRALANDSPDLVLNGFWDRPTKFAEFAKQCLAPFGYYGTTIVGDLWTVRKLQPPLPDQTVRSIGSSAIISKSRPSWDGNLLGLVQEVVFFYNRDVQYQKWQNQSQFVNVLGKQYAQGRGTRLKYELPQIYLKGPTPIPGRPPLGGMPNIELILQERLEFFRQGFTLPPPIIGLKLRYDYLDVEPGDLVSVTIATLPRIQSGTRGITSQTMRVLRKTVNEDSKIVDISLQDTGYGVGDFGYFAPCAIVTAVEGGIYSEDILRLAVNEYTDPFDALGNAQTDVLPRDVNGDEFDWIRDNIDFVGGLTGVLPNFIEGASAAVPVDFFPTGGAPWGGTAPTIQLDQDFSSYDPGFGVGTIIMPLHNSVTQTERLDLKYFISLSDGDEEIISGRQAYRFYP